ncbi:heavy metal-binding domain-containing protein [Hymenobacter psychrophilus]|uniref:Heavy metal binding domain-containing protein n=1 Tax=Hymenobacter psychrophilus TaxID=651662 RepID=A0A1H3LK90_9BACT|nr:heavy metal-binding domain-containing protein [Hymenobacter psychrophilus]SDY64947.1 hypothetical protein SAMN04488069_11129 [Hymenobacter psychrophilus]
MRTPLLFLTMNAATTLLLSSCDNKAATETTTTETTTMAPADSSMMASPDGMMAGTYYTCEMHPEVHADHPGKCPKCGMNLTKTTAAK